MALFVPFSTRASGQRTPVRLSGKESTLTSLEERKIMLFIQYAGIWPTTSIVCSFARGNWPYSGENEIKDEERKL